MKWTVWLRAYAFAFASVLLALVITRWIGSERAGVAPLFFAAVVVTTWRCGLGPGIAATFLSAVATAYFLLPPVHSLAVLTDDAIRLIVFTAVAILISYLHNTADRARARAEEAQRQADHANQTKDRFLAAVSHDLRNPLSAILLWTKMLEDTNGADRDPALRHEALTAIRESAEAQTRLVEDLVDTARIAAGKMSVDVRPIDLAHTVRATANACRPLIERAGLTLELALPRESRTVLADPDRTRQILGNLLANAIKFSDSGGRIRALLEYDHAADDATTAVPQARVSVTDEGRGIAPEFLPRVFDRFAQQEGNPHAKLGLGLGLAIARHLVERQGGSITARSEGPGRGATFTFAFPTCMTTIEPPTKLREPQPHALTQ